MQINKGKLQNENLFFFSNEMCLALHAKLWLFDSKIILIIVPNHLKDIFLNPDKYLWVGKTNKLDFDECVSMHKCQHKSVSGITSEIFIMSSFSSKCTLWGLQIHYKRITAPNLEENTNVGALSNDSKNFKKKCVGITSVQN